MTFSRDVPIRPTAEHAHLAEEALSRGKVVRGNIAGESWLCAPDVIVAQAVANGEEEPNTLTIRRDDGRTAYFFLDRPEGGELR